jgi:hypothetical protein
MNREEFQKELSSRFQNTESGFGNMTQRELILLQIASNLYESEVKKFRLGAVMVRSEQLPCSHCGRPLKEHSKDSKLCPDRMKNFKQGN